MSKPVNPAYIEQQRNEITEYVIYQKLAELSKDSKNREILLNISKDEKRHYDFWRTITGIDVEPNNRTIKKYLMLAKFFGLSFSLRLMERGEEGASQFYDSIAVDIPDVIAIKEDEELHEQQLIGILNDDRLNYAGAIVLGLNDALVEFTGTLAGLTFAFGNNKIIGVTGLVMGVAASLSMAASGYLASQEDERDELNPVKSAAFTGIAYIVTVAFLVFPYLIQDNPYYALGGMLIVTILIIAAYTYYISVAKNVKFSKRFSSMVAISLGVAVLSFGIGMLVKQVFNVDM
jgi:VIT1/CCC1 family predicted Fe2+/Mn2+ transporter